MRGNRIGVLVAIAAGAAGCSGSLPPRPEIVLFIDTDAPVVGQLAGDATLSADAAIDTVRVEVFSNDGAISRDDLQTFLVPQASSWPVSFGIDVSKHGGSAVRVRVRGFRSDRSTAGLLDGKATLDPIPEATIDRLVDLPSPSGGVDHVRVTLHGACMGAPAGFDPPASCIDEHTLAGDPTAGVDDVDPRGLVTAAGSWTDAAARPCDTSPPADAPDPVCVQGGFTLLGDVDFQGVDTLIQVDSAPLIPAVVSPVYLDREEFTVGRLRQLVLAGSYTGDMPLSPGNPGDLGGMAAACTWVDDPHDASHDDLPLTCVFPAVADAICAAVGGFLPSEAAWEHAARGRGAGRLFPWGEDAPSCDRVCASRRETPEGAPECSGPLAPAGSHPDDVSRDGILDMGGSVGEMTSDVAASFADTCWRAGQIGVVRDPVCPAATAPGDPPKSITARTLRGGSIGNALAHTAAPYRGSYTPSTNNGLRCAYAGASP